MRKYYKFGHSYVEINMPDAMKFPKNMELFEVDSVDLADEAVAMDMVYHLQFADNLAPVARSILDKYKDAQRIGRKNMQLLIAPDMECRMIGFEGAPVPYAIYLEERACESIGNTVYVWVDSGISQMLEIDTIFVSLLGLEKVVLQKEALILHCAYMYKDGKAVLFSAPSETGKSTQAGLWEKYRGTRQVNGDKSLLTREPDGWYANGWPICGSSEICHNEAYPIEAIVMLFQAKENSIRRLRPAEALRKVFSQITINMWNSEYQMKAMDLIQQIIMEVPVYELGCDISEDAVKCLEEALESE